MIPIQCVGRRRLEVSYCGETDSFEIKIYLGKGVFPDKYIATLMIEANEFEKLGAFFLAVESLDGSVDYYPGEK